MDAPESRFGPIRTIAARTAIQGSGVWSSIPWERLASAVVPGEASELRLMRRGAEFSIMLGQTELMNSRRTGSERALGTMVCRRIRDRPSASVLIGGLGMGFTLRAAQAMDAVGNKGARLVIAMIKIVAPAMALRVIDRAIQAHGGAGVSGDFFLAAAYAAARTLRLADGPDEVHLESVAKLELSKYA